MRYSIEPHMDKKERDKIRKKGLYCYDIRQADIGGGYATIERNVVVNRAGTIVTDKEIYLGNNSTNNYINFEVFALENEEVGGVEEVLKSKDFLVTIKLDSDERIIREFDFLFSDCENYDEINILSPKEKKEFIKDHYADVSDYDLFEIDNDTYNLFRIDYSKHPNISKRIEKLDNNINVLYQGYRKDQAVALIRKDLTDSNMEYIIAFNYNVENNKMDWGYGYYYGTDFMKAYQDFSKVMDGGNLSNTFETDVIFPNTQLDDGIYVMDLKKIKNNSIAIFKKENKTEVEYILATDYKVKDNKLEWYNGYFYDNYENAKKDYKELVQKIKEKKERGDER